MPRSLLSLVNPLWEALSDSRAERFAASNLVAGAVAAVLVGLLLWFSPPTSVAEGLALAWLCMPLALSRLPRLGLRLELCQAAAVANLAGLITFLAAVTGGPRSFLIAWFIVIPMEAAVHGRRPLIFAAVALAASGLLLLAGLDASSLLPAPLVTLEGVPLLYALGTAGAVVYSAGLALTIQDQNEASERAARDGEARYRLLADHAVDLITRHDPDGTIAFASPAARALLGRGPETLIGQTPSTLAHPDDRLQVLLAYMRASTMGEEASAEYRIQGARGHWIWVETRCRPAPGPTKRIGSKQGREVVAVTRDITPRKDAEAALIAARDEAEAASRAKSRFLANMSHELRTPLNAIIGFSDMMTAELFGPLGAPRYREYAGHIHASGRLLLDLINDVLDMAKVEAGKRTLQLERLVLPALVEDVLSVVRPMAEQRALRLVLATPDLLSPFTGDRRSLKQILLNLLSNAIKFTPPGGSVTVELAEADGHLKLAVRDTGVGIPAEDLGRLGKPFEQVDGDYVRSHEGTGLGLALVRTLTELHGGTFSILSTQGEGTEVVLTFPLASPRPEVQTRAGEPLRLRGAA